MTNTTHQPIRLSVSEAAKLFGVAPKTIRDAIKNGDVRYIVVQGRYKIAFDSLVTWSQSNARRQNKLNHEGIGQYIDQWKISNKKFSPNPHAIKRETDTDE